MQNTVGAVNCLRARDELGRVIGEGRQYQGIRGPVKTCAEIRLNASALYSVADMTPVPS